ncbi:MAG: hypothetical protein AAF752_15415, partial [Bacteroidota bacterium]
GWDFSETPVLIYRPGVQDVLLNIDAPPQGFRRYAGPSPLGDEPIYVRDDSTQFDLDGQNTVIELAGQWVLVVADPASSMRNSLRSFGRMDEQDQEDWLEDWGFLSSPYGLLTLILHEGFHAFQYEQADKFADETVIAQYPALDAKNNALHELEGRILHAAVTDSSGSSQLETLRQFVAVREARHARLAPEIVEYELRNEFTEGLAKYIEYRFFRDGTALTPRPESYLAAGFRGYGDELDRRLSRALDFASRSIAGEIRVNGSYFGAGPIRFKLYPLGGLQALLLDEVMPGWKSRIFAPGVYQTTLLTEAAGLASFDGANALAQAKARFDYEAILADKRAFERDGRASAQEKLDAILNTNATLVRVRYGDLVSELAGLGFTPFGVTRLDSARVIYDLVPVTVDFDETHHLSFYRARALLVDTEAQELVFSVPEPAATFTSGLQTDVSTDTFDLNAPAEVDVAGKTVQIALRSRAG